MNSGGAGDQQGWRCDQARPYHSPRRQLQAEQTRAEILAAARRLFSERGYVATPIQRQSRRRGRVGADALHTSVGSKAQIALSLVGFINDEVDMDALAAAQHARHHATGAAVGERPVDAGAARTVRRHHQGAAVSGGRRC